VTILSDSRYLVDGFQKWLPGWEARGWRNSSGKTPENRDLWERLKVAAEGLPVTWRWVQGHNGNRWNELADELAGEGAKEAQRRGARLRPPLD